MKWGRGSHTSFWQKRNVVAFLCRVKLGFDFGYRIRKLLLASVLCAMWFHARFLGLSMMD
jgi:hypothetical protein